MAKKEALLEYFVPIQNSGKLNGEFMINGIAINETTTSNGHKFLGEELRSAARTLISVPLLKDHNNSVDSIVGRVKNASFDEASRNVPFSAVVKDESMKQKIKDGLINSVSVGAHVDPNDIEQTDSGELIPHNITFKELSLVAVPADAGATFTVALNNAYKLRSSNDGNLISNERGSIKMNDTEQEVVSDVAPESETPKAPVEEPAPEASAPEEAPEEKEDISELVNNLVEAKLKKALKEADVDEEPAKEEPKKAPEEKEEDEDEEEEEPTVKEGYTIKEGHGSFTMERKSYHY